MGPGRREGEGEGSSTAAAAAAAEASALRQASHSSSAGAETTTTTNTSSMAITRNGSIPLDPLRTPLHLPPAAVSHHSYHAGGISDSGVRKVNQVDAHVLDTELLDLLRMQLGVILSPPFFPPGFMDR